MAVNYHDAMDYFIETEMESWSKKLDQLGYSLSIKEGE
jgi:hypothetical protein